MKKNLITVIIFALVLVNLVLTAVLTFSVVPQTKKANALIEKVCNAIDLDLTAGEAFTPVASIPIDSLVDFTISEAMTINLAKTPGDDKSHYAVLTVTLSLNKDHADYKDVSSYENLIKAEINKVVSAHTYEDMNTKTADVQAEILESLRTMFGSSFIVSVGFSGAIYQ